MTSGIRTGTTDLESIMRENRHDGISHLKGHGLNHLERLAVLRLQTQARSTHKFTKRHRTAITYRGLIGIQLHDNIVEAHA